MTYRATVTILWALWSVYFGLRPLHLPEDADVVAAVYYVLALIGAFFVGLNLRKLREE